MAEMTFTRSAHQFKPGRHVWVRPARWTSNSSGGEQEMLHRFAQDEPFEVLEQVTIRAELKDKGGLGIPCPHYLLLAPDGATWQVAQLEVSGVPLGNSKECVTLGAPRKVAAA
jgi:hypothetical protein